MSAAPVHPAQPAVVDLRDCRSRDLAPLLDEQSAQWAARFHWDFESSRDVIQRFVDMQSLFGYVLMLAGEVIGYCYFVHEDTKALVGDLYIRRDHSSPDLERLLLEQAVKGAAVLPGVRRVEGQVLSLSIDPSRERIYGRRLRKYDRCFMLAQSFDPSLLRGGRIPQLDLADWSERLLGQSAVLIRECYADHVDSQINDQYQSLGGARRFLHNTTQHPGAGVFFRPAATVAIDKLTHEVTGLCLGSLVQSTTGHITQLCVSPHLRGRGLGSLLLVRAMERFADAGCTALSLTVTASNRSAIGLYERAGFRVHHRFPAFVWEVN